MPNLHPRPNLQATPGSQSKATSKTEEQYQVAISPGVHWEGLVSPFYNLLTPRVHDRRNKACILPTRST
jgi:hypothetical protein